MASRWRQCVGCVIVRATGWAIAKEGPSLSHSVTTWSSVAATEAWLLRAKKKKKTQIQGEGG